MSLGDIRRRVALGICPELAVESAKADHSEPTCKRLPPFPHARENAETILALINAYRRHFNDFEILVHSIRNWKDCTDFRSNSKTDRSGHAYRAHSASHVIRNISEGKRQTIASYPTFCLVLGFLSDIWPADCPWPADVRRPNPTRF